jgi:hypothetical protein
VKIRETTAILYRRTYKKNGSNKTYLNPLKASGVKYGGHGGSKNNGKDKKDLHKKPKGAKLTKTQFA